MAITFSNTVKVNIKNLNIEDKSYSFDYEIIFNGRSCKGNYDSTFTTDAGKMHVYLLNGGAEELALSVESLSDNENWKKIK
jgi:hypothetical protein